MWLLDYGGTHDEQCVDSKNRQSAFCVITGILAQAQTSSPRE